jgi:porin
MLKFSLTACSVLLAATTFASAQDPTVPGPFGNLPTLPGSGNPGGSDQGLNPGSATVAPDGARADSSSTNQDAGNRAGAAAPAAISSNPAANDIFTGTGALGRFLGFDKESGVRVGGAWIGDTDWLMSGGRDPGQWSYNSLFLLDLTFDFDKLMGVKGGMFGIQFLQYDGQPTNQQAGAVQGYNSLEGPPPLNRTELYELWYRQKLFDDKLTLRIGKTVPTYDFNNVGRPAPTDDPNAVIPSVTGLLFTPAFVNPTLLTKISGYYDSTTGITATYTPTKNCYVSYGAYDGNVANGEHTGERGPQFNGHYFYIAEAGCSWTLGSENKPGNFAVGVWDQTGPLTAANQVQVNGADGVYLFGAQRLWFARPGLDNSGVSGYYQGGFNNSNTMLARQYVGSGLTGFGLVPQRPKDSMGCGAAWSWLNTDPNAGKFFYPGAGDSSTSLRTNELMLQSYYQAFLKEGAYFEPAVTYIPNPGERPDIRDAWALTFRVILLF